jgi:hypothetical protein
VQERSADYPPGARSQLESNDVFVPMNGKRLHFEFWHTARAVIALDRFGFFIGNCDITGLTSFAVFKRWEVAMPFWALVLFSGIGPARTAWSAIRSRRRRSPAACLSCGYDLTANLSGTCPECGTSTQLTQSVGANRST